MAVDERRVRSPRNNKPIGPGPVVYWMQRDQRVEDNWALLYAQDKALERQVPLLVVFNLVPTFGFATLRQYEFMLRGLSEVEWRLRSQNIAFLLTEGWPTDSIVKLVTEQAVGEVVTDFNPLRFTSEWREKVGAALPVRCTEVDAHNIVPCWVASPKQEFAAYTFRPKVERLLPAFLTEFPAIERHPHGDAEPYPYIDWGRLLLTIPADRAVPPVPNWIIPGANMARQSLEMFCEDRLTGYAKKRNDPNENALSNLSPYFHFGQLAPQRAALSVSAARHAPKVDRDAYLEELIVRRELSDNYCFYNPDYDRLAGAPAWAQESIREHALDAREHLYTRDQLEQAKTHEDLWNAMQRQLTKYGKLHGWCRMYWAKKILEWTPDVQTAIDYCLYLNDRYSLDGNDPNGVVGVMWSMVGLHDRAWNERPIFGKIRYMNYAGAKRKFDVQTYVAGWSDETLFS